MSATSAVQRMGSRVPRIGILLAGDRSYPSFAAFLDGLRDFGFVEGLTIEMDVRFAEGQLERLPGLAADLAALQPDLIAVIGAVTFLAAREATSGIPIVFAIVLDAVAAGLVDNANHPGGNVTGATSFDPEQARRQIQILKQTLPRLSRLAVLGDAGVPTLLADRSIAAAEAEGLHPHLRLLGGLDDVAPAMAAFRREAADALLALEVPRTSTYGSTIAELAVAARLPTMFGRDLARIAPMLAYGTSLAGAARCMAGLVGRILRGAKPGDLPVDRVTEPELIVNLKVARVLGVQVPTAVLAQAIQVVE